MKKIIVLFCMFLMVIVMGNTSCETVSETDSQQTEATQQMMSEANRQVGMPQIVNWQQRKLMKMVYELADREDLICYVYLQSEYSGELVYIGKSIGYGVPFSAQFTNPEYIAYTGTNVGALTLPQPDPNGLYMPTSSSATWLLMIDPEGGEPRPVYIEPLIVISPFELPTVNSNEQN